MKEYTNYCTPEYCTCCQMAEWHSFGVEVCMHPCSNQYGTPRTRKTRDGKRWLKSCSFYINRKQAEQKLKKTEKLRYVVQESFKE